MRRKQKMQGWYRVCATLLLAVIMAGMLSAFSGCGRSQPPALEDIYDTVICLIEQSYAVNDVVFGHGLPVWAIGSEYAELQHMYSENDYADYQYVTEYAPFRSTEEIKTAMEAVYSSDYLESLYETMFDGMAYGDRVSRAQLYENDTWLYQSVDYRPLVTWQRIYDYASMRIVSPSSATYVTIEMDSYLEDGSGAQAVRLGFSLENSVWRLDTPTY